MNSSTYPMWWDRSIDFAWDHIKVEMKRDWSQLKNRLRGNPPNPSHPAAEDAPQTGGIPIIPSVDHASFEELENAFRFGYGARLEYDVEWDDNLEICLAKDWRALNPLRPQTWEQDRDAILYGWNFEMERNEPETAPATDWNTQKKSGYFDMHAGQGEMATAG